MKIRFGKYVLFFGKAREPTPEPKQNLQMMDKLEANTIEVTEPQLTREEKVRKWQSEHKEQINARRKEVYEQRKADNKCVKCGGSFIGVRAKHPNGRPFLMCAKCRNPTPKVKRGVGRPKGSPNKRKVGRPKKVD